MVMAEGDNVLGMVIELIFLRCVFFGLKLTKYWEYFSSPRTSEGVHNYSV